MGNSTALAIARAQIDVIVKKLVLQTKSEQATFLKEGGLLVATNLRDINEDDPHAATTHDFLAHCWKHGLSAGIVAPKSERPGIFSARPALYAQLERAGGYALYDGIQKLPPRFTLYATSSPSGQLHAVQSSHTLGMGTIPGRDSLGGKLFAAWQSLTPAQKADVLGPLVAFHNAHQPARAEAQQEEVPVAQPEKPMAAMG